MRKMTVLLLLLVFSNGIRSQELATNCNHDPILIDNRQLARAGVRCGRTTPRIYGYFNDSLNAATDEGLQRIIDASFIYILSTQHENKVETHKLYISND